MDESIKEYTPAGKIKRPSYSLVVTWVKEAWDNIDPAMIQRSFKCCRISTAVDGSEDNRIFDFAKVSDEDRRGRGIEEEGESSEEEEGDEEEESGEEEEGDKECDYYENEEGNYVNIWG